MNFGHWVGGFGADESQIINQEATKRHQKIEFNDKSGIVKSKKRNAKKLRSQKNHKYTQDDPEDITD